jgi:hypothetical protein
LIGLFFFSSLEEDFSSASCFFFLSSPFVVGLFPFFKSSSFFESNYSSSSFLSSSFFATGVGTVGLLYSYAISSGVL